MKGKLRRKEQSWFIEYKMEEDLIATDGGRIPFRKNDSEYLNSIYDGYHDDIQLQPAIWEGMEVEFEMVGIANPDGFGGWFAKLLSKFGPPELRYRDGTPMRSYHSPKIQELLDEIELEEVSKEQLEKERNPAYLYFDPFKDTADYIDEQIIQQMVKSVKKYTNEVSENEIDAAAKQMFYNNSDSGWHVQFARNCFKEGAKWMESKMKNK